MELMCYSDCIRTEYLWFAELFRCLVLNVTTVILAKPRSANNFSHYWLCEQSFDNLWRSNIEVESRLKQSRVDQSLNLDATMTSRGSIKHTWTQDVNPINLDQVPEQVQVPAVYTNIKWLLTQKYWNIHFLNSWKVWLRRCLPY